MDNKNFKKTEYFLLAFFLVFLMEALSYGLSFEDFKKSKKAEFSNYQDTVDKDFNKYKKELEEAFKEYRKKASLIWGEDNVEMPDGKKSVSYFDDMSGRTIIDFEKGSVKIEVAVSEDKLEKNHGVLADKVKNAVSKSISAKPDTRSFIDISKSPNHINSSSGKPLLHGLVKDEKGREVTSSNAVLFASSLVQRKKYKMMKVEGGDHKKRVVVVMEFPLVEKHLEKRANKYKKYIVKYSKKRKVMPELIFAVVETESSFNPTAKSPVPAFGLMQLVPTTAGRDAYKLVHRKDKAPTDRYLYNPENNIRLGTAYFYILLNRYLDEIESKESRMWCAIAAYNTGIGNVFKTFIGKYDEDMYKTRQEWKLKAFEIINSMPSEDVYNLLEENLPYEETREYVGKVRERMKKYKVEYAAM